MSRVKCYNCKKEGHFAKDCMKEKVKDYEYYKTKMQLAKKDKDEQVLLAEDQAWMESSSDSDQEINANMVFMAQIKKVLSDSEASSSSADEKISEVSYYLSESESESEFETLEYYDNSTNYGLFVNNDDDQEIFHDAIDFASENFIENLDKLIRKFNKKIVKCQNRVEKANQQRKDFENQNKVLQDKYDVLKNQTSTFEINNNELNEQMKELIEKNNDLLAQMKLLKEQLQVKHVVIDTHVEWLQVNQFSNGIFINQSKYILDILKRLGMENCDTVPTPMVEQAKLKLDLVGKPVDHTDYRSMIGSLMYVTLSRPDIMFATCICARYQANPNEHHVSAIKRIFRYLKGTINLGLWYPKDSGFDLTAYSDADHAGCHLDRKSTSGSVQFLGDKLVCWSSKKQNCVSISTAKSEYVTVSSCCAQVL
nr:uncharacterized mitochondrial protein AtMg00810-like [Tanacetum cinerariifolium]